MNAATSLEDARLDHLAARTLVTGPPGSGKSKLALDLFDDAVRRHGPDAALIVFPTYGQVEHAKRLAISRRGDRPDVRGLLDVSYVTFTSLGERSSLGDGVADGFRVRGLPSRRARDRMADEALRASDAPLFRAVRDRPGFRARFLRLIKELKQTGEPPASLLPRTRAAASALESGARERLLAFLDGWERYEALLTEAATPDHEDALRSLVEGLALTRGAALAPVRLLVVDGFEDFSGVEALLLDAVGSAVAAAGGRVIVTLPWDDARGDLFPSTAQLRARLVGRGGYVERRLTGFPRSSAPAIVALSQRLFGARSVNSDAGPVPALLGPGKPSSDVSALVGADPSDEWDRIGRAILRLVRAGDGTGFRDIGIVVRRIDGVATTARRVLERLGIPVRIVGGGESLATAPVVRALTGPLRLLAGDDGRDDSDFDAHALLDYLRWRALDSGAAIDVDAVDATDLRWRTERFPSTWQEIQDDLLRSAERTLHPTAVWLESMRREAADTKDPGPLLERVISELLPLRAPSGFDERGRPRDADADARLARARAAKRRLLELVAETGSRATASRLPFADAVGELLTATDDVSCEPADRRLDAVSVLDAEEARHWELPVVFVAGLVEKGFPLHPREDLFLRDEDREALGARLLRDDAGAPVPWRTTRDAEIGERRLFFTAVTRARERLVLSRAARDESGRETAPSYFWRDVAQALGRPSDGPLRFGADPEDLDRSSPPLVDVATEDDLRRFVAGSGGATGLSSDDGIASWLARARRFRRVAEDPLPPSATAAFAKATERLSPSGIQAGLDCPHRFFLKHVARVPEDDAPLRGTSADRRRFGVWIHAALEKAVRSPDATEAEIVAEVLAERGADVPDGADRAWYEEDLLRIVRHFREREAEAAGSGYTPAAGDVEIDFAKATREVRLGSGEGVFVLTGRIDRLDTESRSDHEARGGPRRAIVVDYKTTASTASSAARELRRVEELQLALYARAIESVRGVTVVGLEHYAATSPLRAATADARAAAAFVWRREGRLPTVLPTEVFREALLCGAERRASEVVATVRQGAAGGHRKTPLSRSKCARCGYLAVCRPDPRQFPLVPLRREDVGLAADPDDESDEGDES